MAISSITIASSPLGIDGPAYGSMDLTLSIDDHSLPGEGVGALSAEGTVSVGFRTGSLPIISSSSPTRAPVSGGLSLQLTGQHFGYAGASGASCRFADEESMTTVEATVLDPSHLRCVIPEHEVGLFLSQLKILRDTRVMSFSSTILTTFPFQRSGLHPARQLVARSYCDRLWLHPGGGNDGTMACRFTTADTYLVPANYLSSTKVSCVTPHTLGEHVGVQTVQVTLTVNGMHFTEDPLIFSFFEDPVVTWIYPPFGDADGGYRSVTVHGSNFLDTAGLSLQLGGFLSTASYVSSSEIECLAPAETAVTDSDAPVGGTVVC